MKRARNLMISSGAALLLLASACADLGENTAASPEPISVETTGPTSAGAVDLFARTRAVTSAAANDLAPDAGAAQSNSEPPGRTESDLPDIAPSLGDPSVAKRAANTIVSSNGAYLQSAGICGGASTGFDITSQGFEWLQVGVAQVGSTRVQWGQAWPVTQNYRVHEALPIAQSSTIYVILGWDWTPAGWEDRLVLTSFDRILTGDYSTWFC